MSGRLTPVPPKIRPINMMMSVAECCLVERLRQIQGQVLKKDEDCAIMVVEVCPDGLTWSITKKKEIPPQ